MPLLRTVVHIMNITESCEFRLKSETLTSHKNKKIDSDVMLYIYIYIEAFAYYKFYLHEINIYFV